MFRSLPGFLPSLVSLFLFLPLTGCGSRLNTAEGKVKFKGTPLSTGQVTFVGEDGKSRSSLIGPDGDYQIQDPPLGTVKVQIEANVVEQPPQKTSLSPKADETVPIVEPRTKSLIPLKYNRADTSGVVITIQAGQHKLDINIE